MVTKITTITPAQQARFAPHVAKWLKISLCTDPADFETAKDAALKIYDLIKLPRPKYVLYGSSPYSTTLLGTYTWLLLKQISDGNINYAFWRQARDNTFPDTAISKIIHQVWNEVGTTLKLDLDIKKTPKYKPQYNLKNGVHNHRGGALWANWCSYISFFRDEMGWENECLYNFSLEEKLMNVGWVWWHEDILVLGDRPSAIHLDERGALHCENGPAMLYRDGWSLYAWHGIRLNGNDISVITHPEKITEETIEAHPNQEIRRIMIERFGYDRYMSKSKVVHEDKAGKLRKRRDRNGDEVTVVEVTNGSKEPDGTHRQYFLSVPPNMRTATEAVAWTYGMTAEEYKGLQQRT